MSQEASDIDEYGWGRFVDAFHRLVSNRGLELVMARISRTLLLLDSATDCDEICSLVSEYIKLVRFKLDRFGSVSILDPAVSKACDIWVRTAPVKVISAQVSKLFSLEWHFAFPQEACKAALDYLLRNGLHQAKSSLLGSMTDSGSVEAWITLDRLYPSLPLEPKVGALKVTIQSLEDQKKDTLQSILWSWGLEKYVVASRLSCGEKGIESLFDFLQLKMCHLGPYNIKYVLSLRKLLLALPADRLLFHDKLQCFMAAHLISCEHLFEHKEDYAAACFSHKMDESLLEVELALLNHFGVITRHPSQ
eukprot:GILI01018163.1.p1 GENE.GILI01018163.1~~GILI01018163.1.p1  ORF type:complete len:344 (-),score=48.11 GILI01018163.1:110-1027(-)